MMAVLENVWEAAEFFGCFLNNVNPIVLRIGLMEDRPEWLRGRPKLQNLPRWNTSGKNTVVRTPKITPEQVAERVRFIVEEYEHGWSLSSEGFAFEDVKEAVHFKLSW